MGLIIKTDKKAVTGFDGEERNQKTRRFRSFRKAKPAGSACRICLQDLPAGSGV
jgi:hypothetical protein